MAFPSDALGTRVELEIDGTWTDTVRYDSDTRILQRDGIAISRGAGGLETKTPPGNCRWTWLDPNGIYNNENPRSPYFGILPRNTPVRVAVPRSERSLYIRPALRPAVNQSLFRCYCLDSAGISVTGDIDIRIDIEPKSWTRWGNRSNPATYMILAAKYNTGGIRSWFLMQREDGALRFTWSSTGAGITASAFSTANISFANPRLAVRATLDVNNGSGGWTVTFYTASTINGSWTQLGAQVTGTPTTSIHDNNAALELGTLNSGADPAAAIARTYDFVGRIFSFEMYNGIAGSLVAEADFTAQTEGDTSFSDGLGNTWQVDYPRGEITDADYRFYGQLSATRLTANKSSNGVGVDVRVSASASGLIQSLQINNNNLQSPIYRKISSSNFSPHGWWTGEDASTADTTNASSAVSGADPAILSNISFNGYDSSLAGSAGVMTLGATPSFVGTCKATPQTTETHFVGYSKFPSNPVAEVVLYQIFVANSTIAQWNWCVSNTGYILRGYNAAGTEVATKSTTYGAGAEPTNWIAWHMQLTDTAGTIAIKSEWTSVTPGATVTWTMGGIGTLTYAGSNGVITGVTIAGTSLSGVKIAHIMASTVVGLVFYDGLADTFAKISGGYTGERADDRFRRICELIDITPMIWGELSNTEQMGPEPIATGINTLYQCAEVDGGVIVEASDQLALEFYTRKYLYNQQGTLSLTWAQLATGLESIPDNTDVANDILLSRDNGGSARATLTTGPMSIQAPPDGIGLVPDAPSFNNYRDSRIPALVQQLLMVRTWPDSRYPKVAIKREHPVFTANTSLALLAQRQQMPMRLVITDLPDFLPPIDLELIVRGVNETLYGQQWPMEWVCTPYGPYKSSEGATVAPYTFKAAHTTKLGVVQQQLNASVTSSATSFAIKTLSGALFSTAATSIPVLIGGELMTIGSITGSTSPQTANSVTRGVNGYSAAHNADDYVVVYPTLKARL